MGDVIFGAFAVENYNFDKNECVLSRSECGLFAATLPNPIKYNSKEPDSYLRKRQRKIEHEMKFIPTFPKEGEDINHNTVSGGVYRNK